MRALAAQQPLAEHRGDGGGDEERLDVHLQEPHQRADRVLRVERRHHLVAGQRTVDRHVGRFAVADLSHEDDVRILPDDGAK